MALAALLPVTSKEGSTRATKTTILAKIRAVADSLPDGSRIYLGIDDDDTVLLGFWGAPPGFGSAIGGGVLGWSPPPPPKTPRNFETGGMR